MTFDGIKLSKNKNEKTTFEIGRPNTGWNFLKVRVGDTFAKNLTSDASCINDGIGDILGKCPDCGIEITETTRKKVWGKYGDSSIEVYRWGAAHTFMTKIEWPRRGMFFVMNVNREKKLLLVEERPNDRKDQIAFLLYAEPQRMGRTLIACPFQPEPFNRAVGQRWASKNPSDGVGAERLMILKAGDQMTVKQFRQNPNSPGTRSFTLIVTPDLSVRVMTPAELATKAKAEVVIAPTAKVEPVKDTQPAATNTV
jgi:hypothetical protein